MPHLPALSLFLWSLALPLSDEASQWSGFRGNNGCGVSGAASLPDALDPESNLVWKVEVPPGYSSPVVAGKNLFLTGATSTAAGRTLTGKLFTLCLDAYTGETRWKNELEFTGERPGQNSPAAPSPVTDGERVIALFHHLGLVAYDVDGKELWRQAIGPFSIPHGMSTSPLLSGDLVVLQVDQDRGSYLIAFDKKTGAQRWRTERPDVTHSYATPAIHQPENGPAQVVVSGTMQVAGYALADGQKLWWLDGSAWQSKSLPVFARGRCYLSAFMPSLAEMQYPSFSGSFAENDADKDGKITKAEYGDERLHALWFLFDKDDDKLLDEKEWRFALASNDAIGGLFAIDLAGKGDLTKSNLKWKVDDRRVLSDVTSPVIVGDALFVVKDGLPELAGPGDREDDQAGARRRARFVLRLAGRGRRQALSRGPIGRPDGGEGDAGVGSALHPPARGGTGVGHSGAGRQGRLRARQAGAVLLRGPRVAPTSEWQQRQDTSTVRVGPS